MIMDAGVVKVAVDVCLMVLIGKFTHITCGLASDLVIYELREYDVTNDSKCL